jgi:hypothetical protein
MNDCKHYASFINGIMDSLKRKGYPVDWKYRFANYRYGNYAPGHVFSVVNDNGNEIWIDPVLSYFDEKKAYVSKIDKKISGMALYQISGTQQGNAVNGFFAKIALSPSRNAYLSMVGLNIHGMATHLYNNMQKPGMEAKLQKKWKKLGGNWTKLKNTILKASHHRNLLPAKKGKHGKVRRIGDAEMGLAVVAILAAAVPVLVALKEFLPKKVIDAADTAIKDIRAAGGLNEPGVQIPNMQVELPPPTHTLPTDSAGILPDCSMSTNVSQGIKQYLPWIIAGGVGLVLLTRKN